VTATGPGDDTPARDPQRPERLLRAEHDTLLPILQRTPEAAFGNPTACPDGRSATSSLIAAPR